MLLVTSLAEVWIEIRMYQTILLHPRRSLPLRKCGLKCLYHRQTNCLPRVTSLAEVWIEICDGISLNPDPTVTSLAEVWIEIPVSGLFVPSRMVTSLAEVWIEIRDQGW